MGTRPLRPAAHKTTTLRDDLIGLGAISGPEGKNTGRGARMQRNTKSKHARKRANRRLTKDIELSTTELYRLWSLERTGPYMIRANGSAERWDQRLRELFWSLRAREARRQPGQKDSSRPYAVPQSSHTWMRGVCWSAWALCQEFFSDVYATALELGVHIPWTALTVPTLGPGDMSGRQIVPGVVRIDWTRTSPSGSERETPH